MMTGWIGDPSLIGWAITLAYALAACLASLAASEPPRGEIHFWRASTMLMSVLCLNKQLDLQSTLTAFGRALSLDLGFYDFRRTIQGLFVVALAAALLPLLVLAGFYLRRKSWAAKTALAGVVAIICYAGARAALFHHFLSNPGLRAALKTTGSGLELGGIFLFSAGAAGAVPTLRRRLAAWSWISRIR